MMQLLNHFDLARLDQTWQPCLGFCQLPHQGSVSRCMSACSNTHGMTTWKLDGKALPVDALDHGQRDSRIPAALLGCVCQLGP